jgi:hypothetical protein
MPETTGAGWGGPYQGLTNPQYDKEDLVERRRLSHLSESITEKDKAKYGTAAVFSIFPPIGQVPIANNTDVANSFTPGNVAWNNSTDDPTNGQWTLVKWTFPFPSEYPTKNTTDTNPAEGYTDDWADGTKEGLKIPQHLGGFWACHSFVFWEADPTGFRAIRIRYGRAQTFGAVGGSVYHDVSQAGASVMQEASASEGMSGGAVWTLEATQNSGDTLDILGSSYIHCYRIGDIDERLQNPFRGFP